MGHLLFVAIILVIGAAWWLTVYSAPWVLSLLIPRGSLIFAVGFGVFAVGLGGAALAAYGSGSPSVFLNSLITAFWGGWLMLAPTAALRSAPQDIEMMERLGLMLVALMSVLVVSFFAAPRTIAALQLWLVLFGAVVATRGITQTRQ